MTGLRPLMLCLLALANTAFWAGLLHLIELMFGLSISAAWMTGILTLVFLCSLLILSMGGMASNGEDGPHDANGGEV